MKIKMGIIKFLELDLQHRDVAKLRGAIASQFMEKIALHNHRGDSVDYGYPLIQYKNIDGKGAMIGIGEGADLLIETSLLLKKVKIKEQEIMLTKKDASLLDMEYGISEELIFYEFVTPWMGLNQMNFKKYKSEDEEGKKLLLRKILIGNLLSMSKKIGYLVEKEIKLFANLEEVKVKFKNNEMIAFKGDLVTNFIIPDYMGIGKSVAKGFGTVKKI